MESIEKDCCGPLETSIADSDLFRSPYPVGLPCKKLLDMILGDTMECVPASTFSSLENLIHYSDYFADGDGLLKAFFDPGYNEAIKRHMYLVALTTIWISKYIKPANSNIRRANLSKNAKKDYQICVLYYCFGFLVGRIPARGLRFARSRGFTWSKVLSNADENQCLLFALELLKAFDLEYSKLDSLLFVPPSHQ